MADAFNHKHERGQGPDRPEKMLEVLGPMEFDADDVGEHEGANRHGEGGVQIGCGREETGNEPDQVRDEDIKKKGGNKGEKRPALGPRNIHHEILQALDDQFQQVLTLSRHEPDASGKENTPHDQDGHDQPRINDMGRLVGKMPETKPTQDFHQEVIMMLHV